MSQPIPNQLTNVEQKTKAKKRRESRRSTQGVTLDILSEAKKVMEEKNKTREENKPKVSRVSSDGKFLKTTCLYELRGLTPYFS